jgi:hypothetical protein
MFSIECHVVGKPTPSTMLTDNKYIFYFTLVVKLYNTLHIITNKVSFCFLKVAYSHFPSPRTACHDIIVFSLEVFIQVQKSMCCLSVVL